MNTEHLLNTRIVGLVNNEQSNTVRQFTGDFANIQWQKNSIRFPRMLDTPSFQPISWLCHWQIKSTTTSIKPTKKPIQWNPTKPNQRPQFKCPSTVKTKKQTGFILTKICCRQSLFIFCHLYR